MALAQIPKIQNPCMKRTMLVGPKKFVGSVENPQIHQYTSKKITFTEFDTLSLVPSAKTASQMTAPGSSKYGGFRSNESSSAMKRPRPANEYGSRLNADMPGKPLDAQSKTAGNVLSEQLETNSFNSAGLKSAGLASAGAFKKDRQSETNFAGAREQLNSKSSHIRP